MFEPADVLAGGHLLAWLVCCLAGQLPLFLFVCLVATGTAVRG